MDTPLYEELDIPDDLRADIERALIERIRNVVQACDDRDDDLAGYDAQLEGDEEYGGRGPWAGSCRLHDPLSREVHTQVVAKFAQATPKIYADAPDADPAMQESAGRQEAWLNATLHAEKYAETRKDLAYNAARDPNAILYIGMKQETKRVRKVMYHDGESFDEITGEPFLIENEKELDPEVEYSEHVVHDETVVKSRDYRVIALKDFYTVPSEVPCIKDAEAAIERQVHTAGSLLESVRTSAFDEDAVAELVRLGPTHDAEGKPTAEQIADRAGVHPTGEDDGMYVTFQYIGYLPRLFNADGYSRLTEELQRVQVCAVVCVMNECVLKLAANRYDRLPYFSTSILRVPNRFLGMGLMQLIRELQEEATANIRATIDGINLEMTPALKVRTAWLGAFGDKYKIAPGALIPMDDMSDVQPFEWTRGSLMGLNIHELVQSRAQNMVGSENYGKMASKQRRVIEVQNVMAAVDSKYSLLLGYFDSITPEVADWIRELELKFGDFASERTLNYNGQTVTIRREDLETSFLYSTPTTNAESDPSVRQAMAQAKRDAQERFWAQEAQLLQSGRPDRIRQAWHAARQQIIEIDPNERVPENYIGQEPPKIDPSMMGMPPNPMEGNPLGALDAMNPLGGVPGMQGVAA
jgi:hypothetical protein